MTFSRLLSAVFDERSDGSDGWMRSGIKRHLQDLEDTSGLLVDQARDTLDTSSSSETSDSGLGDTPAESALRVGLARYGSLDVVSKDLPVSLGSTLAESLAAFSSSRHVVDKVVGGVG